MGLPRFHEQPVLLLMYRTIEHLSFLDRHKAHAGPFEVTEVIIWFLGVFAHAWDHLLDKEILEREPITSPSFRQCGFPAFPCLAVEGEPFEIASIFDLLRVVRNGMAHGNMELLDRHQLRRLRQIGPLPRIKEGEIAGIKLWNRNDAGRITWCTALSVFELRDALTAMMRLCEKRSLWKPEVRALQDQRDYERKHKRAG